MTIEIPENALVFLGIAAPIVALGIFVFLFVILFRCKHQWHYRTYWNSVPGDEVWVECAKCGKQRYE